MNKIKIITAISLGLSGLSFAGNFTAVIYLDETSYSGGNQPSNPNPDPTEPHLLSLNQLYQVP